MIGAIEAGGTKFVCAVADENLKVIDEVTIATTIPEETVGEAIAFFQKYPITSLGIGAFGPIEIRPDASNYGQILNTPKLAWRNFNLYTAFHEALKIPIKIDTDVNAAALAEYLHGHGRGRRSVLYITIGTGVGAGFVLHGETLYGLSHPEMGHILVRQDAKDVFEGNCPTHGNCLEGLVAGPAIEKRYGKKAMELSQEDPVWDYVADYIGQALMTFVLTLSPEVIIIGGGVAKQEHIFNKIRMEFKKHMNGYIDHEVLNDDLENYIVYPHNGQKAGLIGSLELALRAK